MLNTINVCDFNEELTQVLEWADRKGIWVLATANDARGPSARAMSVVAMDGCLWFQTDGEFEKCEQIQADPRAALFCENTEIQGTVERMGLTMDIPAFAAKFKEIHPGSFEAYSRGLRTAAFKVTPVRVKIWKYIEKKPHILEINVPAKTAVLREYVC